LNCSTTSFADSELKLERVLPQLDLHCSRVPFSETGNAARRMRVVAPYKEAR